jgi:predicted amidohydrolase
MAEDTHTIPEALVARFAKAVNAFVAAARDAVADAALNPEYASTPAFQSWQAKALPLLESQNASIQNAAALAAKDDVQPILILAEDKRGLAKDLDGFPLTFAGPDHAQVLDQLETAVVTTAYQLCAAAGIP